MTLACRWWLARFWLIKDLTALLVIEERNIGCLSTHDLTETPMSLNVSTIQKLGESLAFLEAGFYEDKAI